MECGLGRCKQSQSLLVLAKIALPSITLKPDKGSTEGLPSYYDHLPTTDTGMCSRCLLPAAGAILIPTELDVIRLETGPEKLDLFL